MLSFKTILIQNTNAGGVGMFTKETLSFQSLNKYQLYTEGCEDLWITANINNTKKSLGFYIQNDFTEFSKSFELTLGTLNRERAQFYISGDANINLWPELGIRYLKSSGAAAIWQKKQRRCRLSLL